MLLSSAVWQLLSGSYERADGGKEAVPVTTDRYKLSTFFEARGKRL